MQAATDNSTDPTRTCAGCGARDGRDAFVHLAATGSEPALVPDVRRKLGGRGVSVHPRRECFERAAQKGGFARALRHRVRVDWADLARQAAAQYRRRADGLLLAARRRRATSVGTDAARDGIRARRTVLLVLAQDAANRRAELEQAAERLGRACVVHRRRAELGALLGRQEVAVVSVEDDGIAEELIRAVERAAALEAAGSVSEPEKVE